MARRQAGHDDAHAGGHRRHTRLRHGAVQERPAGDVAQRDLAVHRTQRVGRRTTTSSSSPATPRGQRSVHERRGRLGRHGSPRRGRGLDRVPRRFASHRGHPARLELGAAGGQRRGRLRQLPRGHASREPSGGVRRAGRHRAAARDRAPAGDAGHRDRRTPADRVRRRRRPRDARRRGRRGQRPAPLDERSTTSLDERSTTMHLQGAPRPGGCGHPYRVDPDQRHPVQLVGGATPTSCAPSPVRRGSPSRSRSVESTTTSVDVRDGAGHARRPVRGRRLALGRRAPGDREREPPRHGRTVGLAVAGSAHGVGVRWPTGSSPTAVCSTEWFLAPSARGATGGELLVITGTRLDDAWVEPATEWLVTDDGAVGCASRSPWPPTTTSSASASASTRLDQRGRVLDTVVFEQYKQQGNRTYLPSPFAIVAGGDDGRPAWGLHVRDRSAGALRRRSPNRRPADVELAVDPARPVVELRLYRRHPRRVLATHLAEVGGLRRPPDWMFRPWMSANDWNTQARSSRPRSTAASSSGCRSGAVVIEAWSDESTFTVFRDARYDVRADGGPLAAADVTYPPDGAWPDPVGHDRQLGAQRRQGAAVADPGAAERRRRGPPPRRRAARRRRRHDDGARVLRRRGRRYRRTATAGGGSRARCCPTGPTRRRTHWWLAKRRYLVDELGVDGFKTDGGEHAWGDELTLRDGTRGAESQQPLPARLRRGLLDAVRRRCRAPWFSRAGFTGAGGRRATGPATRTPPGRRSGPRSPPG